MSSLTQNISQAIADFRAIKSAIIDKGIEVPSATPTSDYPELIASISGGGGEPEPIYGVSGLYQSAPALTRTDDAVGMSYLINQSSGAIDSDFDSVFPWNEAAVVTTERGKFLRFPRMYFRVGADASHRLTDIAVSKAPSGSGDWYEVNPFMYACYGASLDGGMLVSQSGGNRITSKTRAQMRSYASNSGTGYHLIDLYHRTVLCFLWLIEWATKNSSAVMSGRIRSSGSLGGTDMAPTGYTDTVATPSGTETYYGQMRYHYIEDFVGNTNEIIDGVYCSVGGAADYVTANPSAFSDDTTGKTQLVYSSPVGTGVLAAFGWDPQCPFLCMPTAIVSGNSFNQYFCDYYGTDGSETSPVLYCGSNHNRNISHDGLFHYEKSDSSNYSTQDGTRLIKEV